MQAVDAETFFKDLQKDHQQVASSYKATPQDWERLRQKYSMALSQIPDHPIPLFGLGTIYMQAGEMGLAVALLKRCTETGGGDSASPWINLGAAWKIEHRDEEARQAYFTAIEKSETNTKDSPEAKIDNLVHAYHGMASLYINAGQPDMCIHWCNKAIALKPDRFSLWNKGLALLERGDWEEGFRLYDEAGFMADGKKPIERKLKNYGGLPKWDGEPGKTVICYGEQGVGDEIMFASMIPDLMREARVIIDCDKRIPELFRRSFPGVVAVYPTSDVDAPFPWIADHKGDDLCWFPMGSLGKRYRKRAGDFPKTPFLKADDEKKAKWQSVLAKDKGLKIGISWAGGLKKTRNDLRTQKLEEWAGILKTPNCSFYSLQYHPWAADVCAHVGADLGIPIPHWGDMIGNWDEMAAFVSNLDLVITVNTSLHHLTGGLGVKQWCLTPSMPAWRYGLTGNSPWYGNCTMYRQKKPHVWQPILDKVAEDLAQLSAV